MHTFSIDETKQLLLVIDLGIDANSCEKTINENKQLKSEVEKLKLKLSDNEIISDELKRKLETNDLAKTFVSSGEGSKEAKIKINKIVREIDNCIALLNR